MESYERKRLTTNDKLKQTDVFVDESSHSEEESVDKPGHPSFMSYFLGCLCCPITFLGSWYTVQQNEEVVILNFGKYIEVVNDPGLHFSNLCGRELIPISKAKQSTELPVTKVIDKNGNPVMISGIVFYHFKNSKKAALDVLDPQNFVKDQATAVMKQIVSQYPYENMHDNDDDSDQDVVSPELPCLKNDTQAVSEALVSELQKRVQAAGVIVDNFKLNEVSYAPEVSASLLKRQQAEAIVAARTTLVDGAVKIASRTVNRLDRMGVTMISSDKTKLVSNLLTVICSEEQVRPTLLLGST